MADNNIYGKGLIDAREHSIIIHWRLVGPVIMTGEAVILKNGMLMSTAIVLLPLVKTIIAVDGNGTTHTLYSVATSLYNGIIRNCHETTMMESTSIEIGRIIVIASDEDYPVISPRHAATVLLDHLVVIAWTVKAETTITGNNEQGVAHGVLYTELEDKLIELAMYVA